MLPLSLDDLSNHTLLMLKFCKNKPIGVLLLRQVFFGGERGHFAPKRVKRSIHGLSISEKKNSFASSIHIVSYTLMFNIRMGKLL